MAHRQAFAGKDGVLPPNVQWITIDRSDGDSRRWPRKTDPTPDAERHVNFMEPLGLDNASAIKWRSTVGAAIAECLEYPLDASRPWVLKEWPAGYQLFDHNKGQQDGTVRHDLYLFGSVNVGRFRSPNEFVPHAVWLLTEPTGDISKCKCRYCLKLPQKAISTAFGLSTTGRRSDNTSSSRAHLPSEDLQRMAEQERRQRRRSRAGRVYADVRRVPRPVRLPKGPREFVMPEREKDLRALLGPKQYGQRRWARDGELIWVKLDLPILLGETAEEAISFWPGLVEDIHFKAQVLSKENGDKVDASMKLLHTWLYKVKLLVVSKTVLVGDDHILPYQATAPDVRLITLLQAVAIDPGPARSEGNNATPQSSQEETLVQPPDLESALFRQFEAFDPFPREPPRFTSDIMHLQHLKAATGAYAFAIQIASRVTTYWTPTDEWDAKFAIPNMNGRRMTAFVGTSRAALSVDELQNLGQRMLGPLSSEETVFSQKRYQGLWWGPERIWIGDLVRLKMARFQLAPDGAESIKKPSGTGKKSSSAAPNTALGSANEPSVHAVNGTNQNGVSSGSSNESKPVPVDGDVDMNDTENEGADEGGAGLRSVFMRVDGFFLAQVPNGDGGVQNECRMCGMLYELADDEWVSDAEEEDIREEQGQASTEVANGVTNVPPTTTAMSASEPSGPRGLAQLYNKTAEKQAHIIFEANPPLLSEDPMDTDPPLSSSVPPPAGPSAAPVAGPSASSPVLPSSPLPPSSQPPTSSQPLSSTPTLENPTPDLSGPAQPTTLTHPLPPAPSGLRFRPILRPGFEAVLPLTVLAGRFYPTLLSAPLLRPRVDAALAALQDELQPTAGPSAGASTPALTPKPSGAHAALWALVGLVGGAHNAVDAHEFLASRVRMLREAEKVAWQELTGYWRGGIAARRAAIVIQD